TFVDWGLKVSGGAISRGTLLEPSSAIHQSFASAAPLLYYIQRMSSSWAVVGAIPTGGLFYFAYVLVLSSFFLVALAVLIARIELGFAIMVSPVLLPFLALSFSSSLGEMCLAWISAGMVRMLVIAAFVGISTPLFSFAALPSRTGEDPTLV